MTRWVDDLASLTSAAPLDGAELIRVSDGGVSKRASISDIVTFLSSSFLTSASIGVTVQAWDADLTALGNLSATGFATRIASDTWATRTIGGTTNEIAVSNGDGVAGAPVISLASALVFTGKTITGGTFASPAAITGLPDPSGAQDAATKAYVDSVAAGLDVKPSVKCATTANITLSGEQTVDGILTASSRVLVKNQSTASQNGIYTSASGAWTRATDMDAWTEVPGSFAFVEEGTTNADTAWVCSADTGGTLGTTSITWSQFAGAGTYSASGGLSLSGTQFSIANDGVTYARMQNISATQRVLGRNTAGAGDTEEVTASQVLDWLGATQGQVLYRGASGWVALGVGTSGQFLKTNGAGADPAWATPAGAGTVTSVATGDGLTGGAITSTGTINLTGMQEPGGRLTLTSATPVLTSTVTAQTTVYYTPYKHRFIPIYDGTKFVLSDVGGELSQATTDTTKSPAACTTNSNYDLFVWTDGGTYRCTRGPAWSSSTSRGTGAGTSELSMSAGILVNANAITNGPAAGRGTYVGTIRTNGSSQIDHTTSAIGVWNAYHRKAKALFATDSTNSWTYTTAAFRETNGGSTIGTSRVAMLCGLNEDMVDATAISVSVNAFNANTASGIGIDSSTVNSAQVSGESTDNNLNDVVAIYRGYPGLGYHTLHWLEYSVAAGTTTWWGDNGGTYHQTGLICTVMC